jgi:hypothetical protein
MHLICCNLAALAVAGIFYSWRAYQIAEITRERTLRARVAYLLWNMAAMVE